MTKIFDISIHNPYQDMGQARHLDFFNNLSFAPTVEELNRATASAGGISDDVTLPEDGAERLFGAHIREATATVKKLFGTR